MESNPFIGLKVLDESPPGSAVLCQDVSAIRDLGIDVEVELVDPRLAFAKRGIDVLVSSIALILLSPLLVGVVVAIVAASGGSAFFYQPRIGRGGRAFHCYKFRTMIPNAEQALSRLLEENALFREEWQKGQKLRHDPRITKVGSFLRKTSLDELPQLINVFLGHMSLVGPRPALPQQLIAYGRGAKWYCAVRPGITGLWQVKARGNPDFRRRVALDCYYVRQLSIASDMVILLLTLKVVMSGRGAY